MVKPKKKPGTRQEIGFAWMLPNLLTIIAMLLGMAAINFAFYGRWEIAIAMISLAGILDALDGRTARMLKVSSDFGAHLDSLSDMLVFAVAPAIIIYLSVLEEGGRIAWACCMYYTACCALRLARFNSELPDKPSWAENYFSGVPSPAAAFLALSPIVIKFHFGWDVLQSWQAIAVWVVIVATSSISTLPTFSGKKISISKKMALPAFAVFALAVAIVASRPWESWIALAFIYILLIPFSMMRFRGLRSASKENR